MLDDDDDGDGDDDDGGDDGVFMNAHAEEVCSGNFFYLANVLSNVPAARDRMVRGAAG